LSFFGSGVGDLDNNILNSSDSNIIPMLLLFFFKQDMDIAFYSFVTTLPAIKSDERCNVGTTKITSAHSPPSFSGLFST
jgi:hypothetical protein